MLLFSTGAKAADIYFDGTSGGFSEAVLSVKGQAEAAGAYEFKPSAAAISGARTYDFKTLYKYLGYPSPGYFGSSLEEIQDLETYTSKEDTYYKEVNDYLRYYPEPYTWCGTSPKAAKTMVANIDRIFRRVPALPADIMLFRGIGLGFRGNKSYEVGEEFIEKGYASTSTSFKVAEHFAAPKEEDEPDSRKAVLVIYSNRAGEKGILVDQREDEVILRHGIKFRIMAKKETGKKYDLYLAQACSAPCEISVRTDVQDFWDGFSN